MMYMCICAFKHSVSHELVLNSTQLFVGFTVLPFERNDFKLNFASHFLAGIAVMELKIRIFKFRV